MKRLMALGGLVLLVLLTLHTVLAAELIPVKAGLGGKVVWAVSAGTAVSEGDDLVRVSTMTGDMSAARASIDGTVENVMVEPGDEISVGTVVVQIRK